VPFEALAKKGG